MSDKVIRLYSMAMAYDVRSPMPHLVGPPGCGKSSVIEELADLLGVELHIINVSRLSPLDVEGVQMPHGSGEDMVLRMLPATFWTSLKEGDILLMDEFLRGFPEVYNALLDIFTSRRVGAYRLPRVFIIGASNSTVSYDGALEDRLLHLPVADPRRSKTERERMAKIIVDALGLLPEMAQSSEMEQLLREEVLPMYDILDSFSAKKGRKVVS
jgi:MoxR-like ATPase